MPATATYSSTGNVYVDGVLSGVKWAVSSLTFSFPTDPAFYGSNYGGGETNNNFKAFTSVQQGAVRSILQMYASVVNVSFTEVTETSTQHGDLRLADSDSPGTAWAYYPSTAAGGDAWFNNSSHSYDNPTKANYGWPARSEAVKGAETDATKRALATFGNPFGLALSHPSLLRAHSILRENGCRNSFTSPAHGE